MKQGRTEHFKFDLLDKVMIKEIQRPAVVFALTINQLGTQYRCMYWEGGERKDELLHEWELEGRA